MEKPTISDTNAVFQAGDTMDTYLARAIVDIDKRLGNGYAKQHPELISSCIMSQTFDYNNTSITAALYELSEKLHEFGSSIMDDVKKQETVRATRSDKCRYHLEKRSGVWAIYDLEHPAYTDSPGVHSDSPYVVASWSGEQVHDDETLLHYWQMSEWKQQQALALLALLNAG